MDKETAIYPPTLFDGGINIFSIDRENMDLEHHVLTGFHSINVLYDDTDYHYADDKTIKDNHMAMAL